MKKIFCFLSLVAVIVASPLRVHAMDAITAVRKEGGSSEHRIDRTSQNSEAAAAQATRASDARTPIDDDSGLQEEPDLDPTSLNQKQEAALQAVTSFKEEQRSLQSGSVPDATRSFIKSRTESVCLAWQETSHCYAAFIQSASKASISDEKRDQKGVGSVIC